MIELSRIDVYGSIADLERYFGVHGRRPPRPYLDSLFDRIPTIRPSFDDEARCRGASPLVRTGSMPFAQVPTLSRMPTVSNILPGRLHLRVHAQTRCVRHLACAGTRCSRPPFISDVHQSGLVLGDDANRCRRASTTIPSDEGVDTDARTRFCGTCCHRDPARGDRAVTEAASARACDHRFAVGTRTVLHHYQRCGYSASTARPSVPRPVHPCTSRARPDVTTPWSVRLFAACGHCERSSTRDHLVCRRSRERSGGRPLGSMCFGPFEHDVPGRCAAAAVTTEAAIAGSSATPPRHLTDWPPC